MAKALTAKKDMDNATNELITTLQFLLPGFVTAWIFYAFTSHPRPSQFERVVQALIFTILIQFLLVALQKLSIIHITGKDQHIVASALLSFSLGFVFTFFANNDLFHKLLRVIKITKETSYSSEWFAAFNEKVTYVVIELEDGRKIYGWPLEWPTEPNKGHFLLAQASWLDKQNVEHPMTGVENILIDATGVKYVQFMKKTWGK